MPEEPPRRHGRRHIVVSGDDALATTVAEELNRAGASVVKLAGDEIGIADLSRATAVVCAGDDDAKNLEIALLTRKTNPDVSVVARLANDVLRGAVAADNGPGAILDVADLAAPSVVEACLATNTHPVRAAGVDFIVADTEAPRDAALREIYGDLAPVAVVHGANSAAPGELVPCPGRDHRVRAGDWIALIGTSDELAARGVHVPPTTATRSRRSWLRRAADAARALRDDVNPLILPALIAALSLVLGSTVVMHYAYQRPRLSWVDALYFTAETITTVGYGEFSFAQQAPWLRIFAVTMMFGGVTLTALLVAFVADLLLSRRFVQSAGARRARHLHDHIIVVGLGSFGSRVASDLTAAGYDVAIIERDENNRYLSTASELDVPVIFGDATLRQTLKAARADRARAIAVLTQDDMVNIETGIVLREMLGPRSGVPIVLRIYDRALGDAVAKRFGFANVRSTVDLAAPWFIGAAMGLHVLGTFSMIGQRSFMVGAMQVAAGSELDGQRMFELSTQTRVIAITRHDAPIEMHPRRDAWLRAGDTVYLVGPYRELLQTLRKGQPPQRAAGARARAAS